MWDDWNAIDAAQREADAPRDVVVPFPVKRVQGAPEPFLETAVSTDPPRVGPPPHRPDRFLEAQEKTSGLRSGLIALRLALRARRKPDYSESDEADLRRIVHGQEADDD